jgi:HSP20 family molecular chaperone IbpA
MAFFFPRTVYHTQTPVSPLLSLMNDLETISRPRRNRDVCYVYRTPVPAPAPRPWQPRFNAQETANVYLIRGELPGVDKEHINIEFPEPQKMVITGKLVESTKQATVEPQPAPQTVAQPAEETPAPATSRPVSPVSDGARSRASYQAYVEDSDENDDFDVVSEFSHTEKESEERAATPASSEEPKEQPATVAPPAPAAPAPQPEPTERIIGQFSRTYTFSTPVDPDFVTADLKDGFLTIVVPKPTKPEPRRILIN